MVDLSGKRFGRLVVINYNGKYKWLCLCDCTNYSLGSSSSLNSGDKKSCGCLQKELLSDRSIKHNMRHTTEYEIWAGMKKRCYNPKCKRYTGYGGRGIKVCDRWLDKARGFQNFLEDMGMRPEGKSLDRFPNNDGDYSKENCRWATNEEQARNKRTNVWIEYEGLNMILNDWAIKFNKSSKEISRYMKTGHPFEWCIANIKKDYKSGLPIRPKKKVA